MNDPHMSHHPESVAAMSGRNGKRGTGQARQLLIIAALTIVLSACGFPADRAVRAYDACIARHSQDVVVCEGPRQAYEVDTSTYQAQAPLMSPPPASGHGERSVAARQY
jgi:hypothetical protein